MTRDRGGTAPGEGSVELRVLSKLSKILAVPVGKRWWWHRAQGKRRQDW